MELIVENQKKMPLNLYVNIYSEMLFRWWKVGVGLVTTWTSYLFSKPIMLFLTPEVNEWMKIAIPVIVTALSAGWTGAVAYKRGLKEMERMEQDRIQDRQDFFEKKMRYLIDIGEIKADAPLSEKVDITKAYLEALKN
jgi:hypothetical protein